MAIGVQDEPGLSQVDISGSTQGLAQLHRLLVALPVGGSVLVRCAGEVHAAWPERRAHLVVHRTERPDLLASLRADALEIEAGGVGWSNLAGALAEAVEAARTGDLRWHAHIEPLPGASWPVAEASVPLIVSAPHG